MTLWLFRNNNQGCRFADLFQDSAFLGIDYAKIAIGGVKILVINNIHIRPLSASARLTIVNRADVCVLYR